jgi:hypothetical protein
MKMNLPGLLAFWFLTLFTGFAHGQAAPPSSQIGSSRAGVVTELAFRAELHRLVPQALTVEEGTYRLRILTGMYVVPLEFRVHNAPSLEAATATNQVANAQTSNLNQVKLQFGLQPGQYVLTVTGHPELTAVLTVTPKKGK